MIKFHGIIFNFVTSSVRKKMVTLRYVTSGFHWEQTFFAPFLHNWSSKLKTRQRCSAQHHLFFFLQVYLESSSGLGTSAGEHNISPLPLHQMPVPNLISTNSQYGCKYVIVVCHSRQIMSQLMLWGDCVLHPSLESVRKVFIRKLRSLLRGGLAVGPKNVECWKGSGSLISLELRVCRADCSSCCWHKREQKSKRLKLCTQKAFGSGEEKVQCNN